MSSGSIFSASLLLSLADEDEIDGHAETDGCENEAKDGGIAGDSAGLPGAGAELVNELEVAEDGAEVDDDAEGDEGYSGPKGEAGGAGGEMGFDGADLAEEETEAANGETNAHEGEAGANPCEEGSLGGEVDSGVLLGGLLR